MKVNRRICAWGTAVPSLAALIAILLISSSAFAQSDSNPKWDFFAGYQYTNPGGTVPFTPSNPAAPVPFKLPGEARGGGAAFTYNVDSHWGAEVDAGYSRDANSASSEWTISAGPRFMWRTDSANFFLHAMPSFNRLSYADGLNQHSGIGAILGGGLDIPFSKKFAWRLFQADYVYARHNYAGYAESGVSIAPPAQSRGRTSSNGYRVELGRGGTCSASGSLLGSADGSDGWRTDHRHGYRQQFQPEAHRHLFLERQWGPSHRKRHYGYH